MTLVLRDAWRALKSTPIVSLVAAASLALGIGANTAIFSIVNSLLVRTLPVHDPAALVQVLAGSTATSWTNPMWEQVRGRRDLFAGVFAWSPNRFNLADAGEARYVPGLWASGSFFDVLGVNAITGRTLSERDDVPGGGSDGPVAMISYGLWQRQFGGAPDAIGRTIAVDRVPFRIVGVTPSEFFGPEVGGTFDLILPIGTEPLVQGTDSYMNRRDAWWLRVFARLRPGQTVPAAVAALRGVQPQIREATVPSDSPPQELADYLREPFDVRQAASGTSWLRARYQQPLFILMGVVALVLLIACANIANLLIARATTRRHEFSVRLALGASRWRLARQLLVESLLLSGAGALAGSSLAAWSGRLLLGQLSTQVNVVFLDLSPDWRVLSFTTGATVVTALLFGTWPAFRATRTSPIDAIKEHGRVVGGRSRSGVGNTLVALQVALSLALIVGAGLFMRTFWTLSGRSLGVDQDRVLTASIDAKNSAADPAARLALFDRVRESAAAAPGVSSAAVSMLTAVSGATWTTRLEAPVGVTLAGRDRTIAVNAVSPNWFVTHGIAFVSGRDVADRDRAGAPRVVVINETAARRFFPNSNPVGRTLDEAGTPPIGYEVIGVVKDAIYSSLREAPIATMYEPLAQQASQDASINLSVRAANGSPALLTRPIADAIAAVDPRLSVTFRLLSDQVGATLNRERILAWLSGFFGVLAVTLAGLGVFGVTSYSVSRQRTEIGIRMALGARPARVVRQILTRMLVLVLGGAAAGVALSWWAGRFVGTLLYGVEPHDGWTIAGALVVLAAIGTIATVVPAWRAARIEPTEVLRAR